MIYTVARFPDGSWSYGGSPTSSDYSECQVWCIEAASPKEAIRKAQYRAQREKLLRHEETDHG